MANQKALLDSVGKEIGASATDLSPWYGVTLDDTRRLGVYGLLTRNYNNSLYQMLLNVYPKYSWEPWRFTKLPHRVLEDEVVLAKAIRFAEENLHLEKPEDWYRVSKSHLAALGLERLIASGSPIEALMKIRPLFPWQPELFTGFRTAHPNLNPNLNPNPNSNPNLSEVPNDNQKKVVSSPD